MLEQLLVFTRGGLILWACKELGNALRGSPIDSLIRSCLLEERSGDMSYNYDAPGTAYTLKWTFHNDLGLVFVAVYQRILHLLYVDDLLSMVKQEFSQIYDPKQTVYDDFDETFRQLRMEAEARAEEMKKSKQAARPGRKQGQIASLKSGVQANGKHRITGSAGKDDGDADSVKGRQSENGDLNGGLTAAFAMSRFLALVIILIVLNSSSCKIEASKEGVQHPNPSHKMSIRERMLVEQIMRDYAPSGANDKHDPKPH